MTRTVLLALALLLTGCKMPAPATRTALPPDPNALYTAAAQTAEAARSAPLNGNTPLPEAIIRTAIASSPTPIISPTSPVATFPAGPTVPPVITGAPGTANDRAEFVDDVSIPDGTIFPPNASFTKTWRLQNTGPTTWTKDYALVFTDGSLLGAPDKVAIPQDVTPGQMVDISVSMVAPADEGSYRGYWLLENPSGVRFGVGVNANETFWVDIVVSTSATPGVTATPGSGGTTVTQASLSVEQPTFSGECPHNFAFRAEFVLSRPTSLTYSLEVDPGLSNKVKLPPPATNNFGIGTHVVIYELTFIETLSGWMRLHILAPEDVESDQVNFSLVCQ